jgi:hypothetical protein
MHQREEFPQSGLFRSCTPPIRLYQIHTKTSTSLKTQAYKQARPMFSAMPFEGELGKNKTTPSTDIEVVLSLTTHTTR